MELDIWDMFSDGYSYMKSLGYDEAAKICLTHSFNNHTVDEYIGKFDVSEEELTLIKTKLAEAVYDEYDLLINYVTVWREQMESSILKRE